MGYDDKELVMDLYKGMPIAGPIDPVPTLTTRERKSTTTIDEWRAEIPESNTANVARVVKSQGSDEANACYVKTMKEVDSGWLSYPVPLSQVDPNLPLTPRYALEEQHGKQEKKYRLIGDFKASGLNNTVSTNDTSIPDGLDSLVAACSAYQGILEGRTLLA